MQDKMMTKPSTKGRVEARPIHILLLEAILDEGWLVEMIKNMMQLRKTK